MKVFERKKGICLMVALGTAFMLNGCDNAEMKVTIQDGMVQTRVEANAGETVEEILKAAEIEVSDKDIVTPDLYESISQTDSEIVITRYASVEVVDGEEIIELEMCGKTVQDVMNQMGITLGKHDYLNHSESAFLVDGMEINITRRKAVTLIVDGETKSCITAAVDVAGLLQEQDIVLGQDDRVNPSRTMELKEGSQVTVERVSVMEIVEEEPIEFEVMTEYSGSMYSDEIVEKTPGVLGLKEVTYLVTYVDGVEVSRKAIRENILKEPVAQVVVQGTLQRRRIVSKQAVDDCDGSGHGYYIITWSDGTVEYVDY